MSVEFRVLGPLEVLLDGEPVDVPAGRGRVLLATLLLRPNQFVSVDELIERLWDGEPPTVDRAHKTLQMVVTRLRQSLGAANRVRTAGGGYRVEIDQDELDLLRFRALAGSSDFAAAAALWRGPVLGNVKSDALHRDDVPPLLDERLVVLERRIDADLDRGHAAELVAELRSLVADHPLRESFWRQLMLALYRSGQQAASLAAYQEIRKRLADELGVDPGPALRDLHQRILRADVGHVDRRSVPRQLPAGVPDFVGRDEEISLLGKANGISVVHGVGGVGKTALALQWAHSVRQDFPDGDLYLNLRGFEQEAQPVSPGHAAELLLVGLGVKNVPAGEEARYALLRTELAGRRMLLVLDNAATGRQVLPLLPGTPSVRVIITSRNQLRPLVVRYGATSIALRQLDNDEAHRLLAARLGAARLEAEPGAVREIVERCAGLPLALRVFAERVARFPDTPLHEFASELRTERLDALTDFDDVDVRAVFSWSYRALDPESARMFRLLSVHPGVDLDVGAAAALAGVTVAQARRLLERLVADHLVQTRSPGRYDLHDLLRAYAAELCGDDEAAALRLTEWYVHTLENAAEVHGVTQVMYADEVSTGVVPQEFSTRFGALAWCRGEWDNLCAVMHAALARGWNLLAQMIPIHLRTHYVIERVRDQELLSMFEAVQDLGSARVRNLLKLKLAATYVNVKRFEDALREFDAALPLIREMGDKLAEAGGLNNMSVAYLSTGRAEESLDCNRRSLELAVELGDLDMECVCRVNIVGTLNGLRRHAEALEEADRARAAIRRKGDEYAAARLDSLIAVALVGLGRLDEALALFEQCIEELRRFSDVRSRVAVLDEDVGPLLFRLGRHDDAVRAWEQALELAVAVGNDRADGLEAKLALVRGSRPE
ncbi:BTAD domain-containing putative transcriptional regulator [Lentzea sp. NPDC006480]|uniref:AfsR/SARP family transcriptional regulator n=1 Tax=Lentzea sp. NPDC006480 TaxID=3157176 RepID=UPI0033A04253